MEEENKTFVFGEESKHGEVLEGEKQRFESLIGKEVLFTGYKLIPDKFSNKEGAMVTILQYKTEGKTCITFTRSAVLTAQIVAMKENKKMPFKATIVKQRRYLTFK